MLGLHELGDNGWRWLAVDVVWAVTGGLGDGALMGTLVGRLVLYLRQTHREAVGLDDFLALGLIALSYGGALLLHCYGFLAVFAAGLAVRRIEATSSIRTALPTKCAKASRTRARGRGRDRDPSRKGTGLHDRRPSSPSTSRSTASARWDGRARRVDALDTFFTRDALWFVPLLLLVIRPASVWAGLFGSHTDAQQRHLISWFGVRGIGSIYYLMFAIEHGLEPAARRTFVALTLSVIAVSVIVHGVSVTPLMNRYEARRERLHTNRERAFQMTDPHPEERGPA